MADTLKTWYPHSESCTVCESSIKLQRGRPSKARRARKSQNKNMNTNEHELDTEYASEDEDQLRSPTVYSLTMDCLKECIGRIPVQDQRAILVELCSSLGKQLVDLLTHTKGLHIISEADFTNSFCKMLENVQAKVVHEVVRLQKEKTKG